MARPKASPGIDPTKPATAPATTPTIPNEETDDGSGYSLDSIAELTEKQIATMEQHLDGEAPRPLGPNLALLGYLKKGPGVQLIGIVRRSFTSQSRFPPHDMQSTIIVEGLADYPAPVTDDEGEVTIEKGRYSGCFAFQVDAATLALSGPEIVGARVHLKVKKKATLPSGLKRYEYEYARVAQK